jgi:hypothetical protein
VFACSSLGDSLSDTLLEDARYGHELCSLATFLLMISIALDVLKMLQVHCFTSSIAALSMVVTPSLTSFVRVSIGSGSGVQEVATIHQGRWQSQVTFR